MYHDGDDVILTEHERAELARLEAALAPDGPRRLWDKARRRPRSPATTLRLAGTLVVIGAILATVTFARSVWVASAGLVIMARGFALAAGPLRVLLTRFAARRGTGQRMSP